MEAALDSPGTNRTDKRLRLEHAQIMELKDLQKAAELGSKLVEKIMERQIVDDCGGVTVIASYQPTHATSDVSVVLGQES